MDGMGVGVLDEAVDVLLEDEDDGDGKVSAEFAVDAAFEDDAGAEDDVEPGAEDIKIVGEALGEDAAAEEDDEGEEIAA